MHIPVARRFVCAVVAIVTAALLLRPALSSALVSRGDELSARASILHALTIYRRAIWLDPRNGTAIDRFVFTSVMTHRRKSIESGLEMGASYLRVQPSDPEIILDVALGEQILGRYTLAERDFALLGRLRRDPRAYTFAGFAALRAGRRRFAREWFQQANAIDPHFTPASRVLARLR